MNPFGNPQKLMKQFQQMQEQMQKNTEQVLGAFGLKRPQRGQTDHQRGQ